MADLSTEFLGIKSPNPFWLASAPPTDKEYNVVRAFEAGWGGVVWKTLGEDPPVVNVSGPRYGTLMGPDRHVNGLNNIELITDRPLDLAAEFLSLVRDLVADTHGVPPCLDAGRVRMSLKARWPTRMTPHPLGRVAG